MLLSWIELTDFRCHRELRVEPEPGVNVFIGANGSGKTSLLEAAGFLATLTSFRHSPDEALIRQGAEHALVRGAFTDGGGTEATIEVEIPPAGRKRVLINGKAVRGRASVAAVVALVAFLPDDLDILKEGPALRRDYLDDLAAQLWPAASTEQSDYDKVLRQRNALLRTEGPRADAATLDALDERLCQLGSVVLARRLTTVALVAPQVGELYSGLIETEVAVAFDYEAAGLDEVPGDGHAAALEKLLVPAVAKARRRDQERGLTTVGPHRDEVVISLDGRDARTRASQGEQRSLALGLRLASHRVITERRGIDPVLLLDDVFSELDADRSRRLVERLPQGQVFVTSARHEEVPLVGARWLVSPQGVQRDG